MNSPSRDVRAALETLLATSYHTAFSAALVAFSYDGAAIPQIDFANPGTNYFRADYTIEDLRDYVGLDSWPILCLSTSALEDNPNGGWPRTLDGIVTLRLTGHFRTLVERAPADLEMIPDAFEAAVLGILMDRENYNANIHPERGGLRIERVPPQRPPDRDAWFQTVAIEVDFLITL